MDQEKWMEAEAQVPMVGQVLENVAVAIGKAADDLEKALEMATEQGR
jgi:ABC-type iron transport system FetAB permease component